jgi:hypothetical protein
MIGLVSLEELYCGDLALLERYREGLLIPGWARVLAPYEFNYIKSELRKSHSLRRKWGFRPSAKRLSESGIRHVAMRGLNRKQTPVLASAKKVKILPE